jgi:molybdopterin converting factor small subunit
MGATVTVPTQLRTLTGGLSEVEGEGTTIAEVIHALDEQYPGFATRVLDDSGSIRRFVNVYLNSEDVRFLDGIKSEVPQKASISIIPAVAGG